MATEYTYELRRGREILSTGRLTVDDELAVGDIVHVAGVTARVQEIVWNGTEQSFRLILE
jgi:hypothetical protein